MHYINSLEYGMYTKTQDSKLRATLLSFMSLGGHINMYCLPDEMDVVLCCQPASLLINSCGLEFEEY